MERVVIHSGTFEHRGIDLAFTRWELQAVRSLNEERRTGSLISRRGKRCRGLSQDERWHMSSSASRSVEACGPSSAYPLVLLHGFAQSAQAWAEVAPVLASAEGVGAVYALDFVGHGESARPHEARSCETRPYAMETVCESVRDFCAWVARREGARPALLGYSMGGRIALECLVRFGYAPPSQAPQESPGGFRGDSSSVELPVSALILESAGLGPADEEAREAFRVRNEAWAQQLREQGVSAFMDYWESLPLFASQRNLALDTRGKLRAARESNDAEALVRTFEGTGQHHQHARGETLTALAAAAEAGLSVRYLFGELDAKYAAVAKLIAAADSTVTIAEIPSAGHNTHLENPEAFVRACLDA